MTREDSSSIGGERTSSLGAEFKETLTTEPESPVIYPLVADSGNYRVLEQWLANHDSYTLADDEKPVTDAEFDLCIVDQNGFKKHAEKLRAVKTETQPVLMPVLLFVPERDADIIETDQGAIADNVFTATVDEILSLPLRQAELEWRIQALLRLRTQSLRSQAKTQDIRRFREAVEASGHAIFITDPDGTIKYANASFERITGYDSAEVVGKTPRVLKSGEMSDQFFEELWDTITAGEVWESELINRRRDGELFTAHQTIAPITDETGEIDAFVAVQTDVTDRKELESTLKRHRDIVQRLEDPIMLQDTEGNFELINEAVADFSGIPADEILGTEEPRLMDDETAAVIQQKKTEILETEEAKQYTVSPSFPETEMEATFSTRRYPYYNEADELAGTLAICRDVTHLEERTRQLQVMDNVLRHNLRNGLTVIRGEAEQIQKKLSGEMAESVETILSHIDDLESTGEKSRAITNVLSHEPTVKEIGIAASIRAITKKIAADHPDAEIDINISDDVIVSATFNIDEAIEELLRNAIIHHDEDHPSVEVRLEVDGDTVEIRIVDDGPGISEMDREVLESGRAVEDLYHGSGLGLWLVYWIVNRSGGSVTAEDVEPRGTSVCISLSRSEHSPTE